jgi:hypothetical protein
MPFFAVRIVHRTLNQMSNGYLVFSKIVPAVREKR